MSTLQKSPFSKITTLQKSHFLKMTTIQKSWIFQMISLQNWSCIWKWQHTNDNIPIGLGLLTMETGKVLWFVVLLLRRDTITQTEMKWVHLDVEFLGKFERKCNTYESCSKSGSSVVIVSVISKKFMRSSDEISSASLKKRSTPPGAFGSSKLIGPAGVSMTHSPTWLQWSAANPEINTSSDRNVTLLNKIFVWETLNKRNYT